MHKKPYSIMGRRPGMSDKGFTLIELMVTVSIFAVLSVVAMVSYSRWVDRSRTVEAVEFIQEISSKQHRYFDLFHRYVTTVRIPLGSSDLAPKGTTYRWDDATVGVNCSTSDGIAATPGWCSLGAHNTGDLFFSYQTLGYQPGITCTAGTTIPSWVGCPAPAEPWFYVEAHGDLNGDGKVSDFYYGYNWRMISIQNELE